MWVVTFRSFSKADMETDGVFEFPLKITHVTMPSYEKDFDKHNDKTACCVI